MPSATTLLPDRPLADEAFLADRAEFVRTEAIRLIELAKVGHYSSVFSAAEIFSALYYGVMRTDASRPDWPERDRFLMGKGHAAVGLFPVLSDLGYFPAEVLNGYTRLGSPLGDHPDMTKVPGIDFSSGSIGHALSNGLGMALGGRMSAREFSVFVMLGDGEMQEGQVWEAALAGAHHRLGKLVAIVDRNGFQLDGSVDDVIGIEPLADKWRAFGWDVHEVDGHDAGAVRDLLRQLAERPVDAAPSCVIAHTLKGKGVAYMEEEPGWHLGYLVPADAEAAIAEIRAGSRA
ncbi:transketolase [Herbiconiux sp. 11R-BC]|uniref:transketolase n=1 Tax=Herbiconiux sp. 11R-BC TaxID=3111637 RepID=UPI003C0D1D78